MELEQTYLIRVLAAGRLFFNAVLNRTRLVSAKPSLSRDGSAVVSKTVFWGEDMTACPVNKKVQLYSLGGIASSGTWDGKNKFYVRWAELPRVPKRKEVING